MLPKNLAIDGSVSVVVSHREPYGVQRAARNVLEDIRDVMPGASRLADAPHGDAKLAIVVESDRQRATRCGVADALAHDEAFVIRAVELDGKSTVLISGGGERGAIYGLYHFSHKHLGTDPFKFWTGNRPAARDRVELRDIDETRGPLPFRFRGWHVEGIGVLEGWRAVTASGHTTGDGHLLFWEQALDTLLRCGGNMVKPNTNRPESMPVALAQRMGLLITQEHCCPFGIGMWDIKPEEPGFNWSFDDYPHVFLRQWEDAMLRYPRPENVIWTLGFRGRGDRPFWMEDTKYDTDAKRGKQISRILRIQRELVEKHFGRHKPAFIHNTWMEGNRLVQEGHTVVPEGVHTVWADNGYGTFRAMIAEGCDASQVKVNLPANPPRGEHGVYYHVSMWDYNTPFTHQFVPPSRIEDQLGLIYKKGMSAYLLVNMGRVRNCLTGIAAIADFWKSPEGWSGPRFLDAWCARQFGGQKDGARRCYDALYDSPFKWGEWGGWDDYMVGDVGYVRRARIFVDEALSYSKRRLYESTPMKFWLNRPMKLDEQLTYMRGKTAEAAAKWDAAFEHATATAARLSGPTRQYFQAELFAQIDVCRSCNAYLQHMIDAVRLYEESPSPKVLELTTAAAACLDRYEAALHSIEYPPFAGWVTPSFLRHACLPIARQTVAMLVHAVEQMTVKAERAF